MKLEARAFEICFRLHQFGVELLFDATAFSARLFEIRVLLRLILEVLVLLVHLLVESGLLDLGVSLDHGNAIFLEFILCDVALLHQLGALFEASVESIEIDARSLLA